MKRNLLILQVMILTVLFFSPHNAGAQCPEDSNDVGQCDTLYVETFDCDHEYEAGPGSFDSVRVAVYVTHDSNTFFSDVGGGWVQDSISGFVIPLTFWHHPPGCADSVILPNWDSWNNTYIDPDDSLMNRSMFRHIVDTHTGDTTYNRLLQMVENWKEAWSVITDIESHSSDGDSGHVFLAVIPMGAGCQRWWEGERVLLATLTFHVYMSADCDTTEIDIDSTFWPPLNRLTFARYDAVNYYPRHFLPIKDTIYLPVNVPGNNCDLPIEIDLPAGLPFSDLGQTTCGRVDDYDNTCLGYYDGGEDIIYKLNVSEAVVVDITMDPKGTTWTGMAVDNACPPGDPCMAEDHGSSDSRTLTGVSLDPGTYYIMIDTWPSPDCIPDFDLTITERPECEWVSFDGSPPLTPTDVEVIGCSPSQTDLRVIVHGMCVEDTTVGDETFQLITVPEMVSTPEGGRPQLPARGEMIGLSTVAETVMITDISTSAPLTFENLHVFPLQQQTKSEYVPPFVMDSSFYSDSDYFYPPFIAQTGPVGFWHILPISNIGIFPFQYNPVTDSLRVYDTIYVTFSHPGPPVTDTIPRSFTVIYEALTNHGCVFQHVEQDMEKFKAHVLFIVADNLDNDPSVAKLIEYLKKKGFNVTKMKASDAGGSPADADSIRKTIKAFYEKPECCDKPKYVTLIGDHPDVPGKVSDFGLSEDALDPDVDVLSDEWYELVKGGDYVPDLMVGRIPTSDPATLSKIVDKKIKNDTTSHRNVTKELLVSHKQNRKEDIGNGQVKEYTYRENLKLKADILKKCGFEVVEVHGSTGGTNQMVKDAIEKDSVGEVEYNGHGSDMVWSNWCCDNCSWTKDDINDLKDSCHEPIVWSKGCYNNEIDTPLVDCIGEHWIKSCKATAHFGSSRAAPTKHSNYLDKFIAEAICEFKGKPETADLGHIIMRAKANLAKSVPMYGPYTLEQEYAILTILEYLLLGDPEQTKWTEPPKTPGIIYDGIIPTGPQTHGVAVQLDGSPLEGAIVCLWKEGAKGDEVFEALYTDASGEAAFEINPQTPGVMYVTVWGKNLKVYFGEARVYVFGDANGDGSVNLADAVFVVNWLFIGGPPPDPLEAGDANCDGQVNLADAVYIVNWLFIGGPPPGC